MFGFDTIFEKFKKKSLGSMKVNMLSMVGKFGACRLIKNYNLILLWTKKVKFGICFEKTTKI